MELGKDIETSVIEDKIAAMKPNQCATLVYTVRKFISWLCLFVRVSLNGSHIIVSTYKGVCCNFQLLY